MLLDLMNNVLILSGVCRGWVHCGPPFRAIFWECTEEMLDIEDDRQVFHPRPGIGPRGSLRIFFQVFRIPLDILKVLSTVESGS